MKNTYTPLLSVVVPTYNGEDFLRECLDDILAQTMPDFELICVDDGSTDQTPAILKDYARRDARIRVITQENAGSWSARNRGMDEARGKYLFFLDDDDLFLPQMFEKMTVQIIRDDADICICDAFKLDNQTGEKHLGDRYIVRKYLPDKRPFAAADAGRYMLNLTNGIVWTHLFRLQMLRENGVRFKPFRVAQDAVFEAEAMVGAARITIFDEPLVIYRMNTGKSVWNGVSKHILTSYEVMAEIRSTLIQKGLYEGNCRQSFANRALDSTLRYSRQAQTYEAFTEWYTFMTQEGFTNLDITGHDADYFYNPENFAILKDLLQAESVGEAAFLYYRRAFEGRAQAKENIRRLRARNKELKEKTVAVQERNKELKEKVIALRSRGR